MTDHTDHYAAAELMLDDANVWAAQAGELSPEVSERACLAYAAVHALLAIHDTLTAADRYAANEAKQREEAEPDPLDEDDHRDRVDKDGRIVRRKGGECWAWPEFLGFHLKSVGWPLGAIDASDGPLAFAPEAAQDATGGELTASEGESGAEERGEAGDAQEALLCECGHPINWHHFDDSDEVAECAAHRCPCDLWPSDIARALIAEAVKQTGAASE